MLTALRQSDQVKVLARKSEKLHVPFRCPKCKREVVLHKGTLKITDKRLAISTLSSYEFFPEQVVSVERYDFMRNAFQCPPL